MKSLSIYSVLILLMLLAAAVVFWGSPTNASAADILLANNSVGGGATVSEYDASTGALINSSFLSVPSPYVIGSMAVSNDLLYVFTDNGSQSAVGEYNATTGAPINPAFITWVNQVPPGPDSQYPYCIAVANGVLFVANRGASLPGDSGSVAEYDAMTGATVNASLITGLAVPTSIAVSGGDLFVVSGQSAIAEDATVGLYTTSGVSLNPSLITNIPGPTPGLAAIVISGDNLIVGVGTSEYTTSGTLVNSSLNDLGFPSDAMAAYGNELFIAGDQRIAAITMSGATITDPLVQLPVSLQEVDGFLPSMVVVPEPSSWVLLAIGAAALFGWAPCRGARETAHGGSPPRLTA
jgi:hypothetical protein